MYSQCLLLVFAWLFLFINAQAVQVRLHNLFFLLLSFNAQVTPTH